MLGSVIDYSLALNYSQILELIFIQTALQMNYLISSL